jgi:hypothetical protein
MGIQTYVYENNISILDIYDILKNKFIEYEVILSNVSGSSHQESEIEYRLSNKMIDIISENFNIYICQYLTDSENKGKLEIIYIHLEGTHVSIIYEPMERIKEYLLSNFSEYFIEEEYKQRIEIF